MKKILLSIAVLTSSAVAFAANDNKPQTPGNASTEQIVIGSSSQKDKTDKKYKTVRKNQKADRKKDRETRLFEGITLTDDQKSRLAALKTQRKTDRDAKKKEGKQDKRKLTDEQKQQRYAEKIGTRKAYLAEVKEMLTPQQYVTFLENSYSLHGKVHKSHKGGRAGLRKGGKKSHGEKSMAANSKGKGKNKADRRA